MNKVNVSELQGPLKDFFEQLGGKNGRKRLEEFKLWLKNVQVATLTITRRHDPNVFFRNRDGLYVWDDFRNLVVAKTSPSMENHAVATKSTMLERDMVDVKIEEMLGDGHIFTEDQLCDTLAEMLEKQEGGKEGELLNNGYANIFYLRSFVVLVFWHSGRRRWGVHTWSRDDYGWHAGGRAFSPATEA